MSNSILQAFKGLNVASLETESDHQNVYEVSYQYLLKIKEFKDHKSFSNCIVALINLDKYYKAIDLLKEVPEEIHRDFPLEKAYVYYKLGKGAELNQLFQDIQSNTISNINDLELRAINHIMAQHFYQQGHIKKALELYHQLISSNNEVDNELDLACNERAVISQLNYPVEPVTQGSDDSYDLLFNTALIKLSAGDYQEALELLQSSIDLCIASSGDLGELGPMKVTMAYIYDKYLNDSERSLDILNEIDLESLTDSNVSLIVKNNIRSLKECTNTQDINLVHRELNYQDNLHRLRQKLTKSQYRTLVKNNLLLLYQSGTITGKSTFFSNKWIQQYLKDFPGDVSPVAYKVLVKLGISAEDLQDLNSLKVVSKKLVKHIKASKSYETAATLLLLLYVNSKTSNYNQSWKAIEELVSQDSELLPVLYGALIKLYSYNDKPFEEMSFELLIEKLDSDFSDSYYRFMKMLAFHLLDKFEQTSYKIFQKLHQINSEDTLVAQMAQRKFDESSLILAENLVSQTPIEELLATPIESLVAETVVVQKKVPVHSKEVQKRNNVHKARKKAKFSKTKVLKPAKDFDAKDLDQERWLPLKLRSYYKPTKKERKKLGGHQGAIESVPSDKKKKKKKGKK